MGTVDSAGELQASIAWVGRRKAIVAAGAAAFGFMATMFGGRRAAEAHGTLHVDSGTSDPAIHGANSSDGPGVQGTSQDGPGVRGDSVTFIGVRGASDQFIGVRGQHASLTADAPAILGRNDGLGNGVVGRATNGDGVYGERPTGATGSFGAGVNGVNNAAGPAINALRGASATGFFGAVEAFNLAEGPGVHGVGKRREGVVGERPADAAGSFAAVFGVNMASGVGVSGSSSDNAGVYGTSSNGAGVIGVSSNGEGVRGERAASAAGTFAAVTGVNSASGPGVVGLANLANGEGVVGFVGDASGIGVHARNDYGGIALAVSSKARFKVCGKAAIPLGASSTVVTAPVSPATSLVLLTLLGDPGQATLWVAIGAGSFTVHLGGGGGGGGAHSTIPFAWFAIEQTG